MPDDEKKLTELEVQLKAITAIHTGFIQALAAHQGQAIAIIKAYFKEFKQQANSPTMFTYYKTIVKPLKAALKPK